MALTVLDPYRTLGVQRDAADADVQAAWLAQVRTWQPGTDYPDPMAYEAAMAAYMAIRATPPAIVSTGDDGRPDWASVYVHEQLWRGPSLREREHSVDPEAIDQMVTGLSPLPSHMDGSRLATVPGLDVRVFVRANLALPEFAAANLPADPTRFAVIWRTKAWRSKGQTVLGTCQAVPLKERELWSRGGRVPLWRLTISLPYWLLATEMERHRLIHHELSHAVLQESEQEDGTALETPSTQGHDIEEGLPTLARYGARDTAQAALLFAAIMHPRTRRIAQEERWDPRTGQGIMFPPVRPRQPGGALEEVRLFDAADPIDAYERFLCAAR